MGQRVDPEPPKPEALLIQKRRGPPRLPGSRGLFYVCPNIPNPSSSLQALKPPPPKFVFSSPEAPELPEAELLAALEGTLKRGTLRLEESRSWVSGLRKSTELQWARRAGQKSSRPEFTANPKGLNPTPDAFRRSGPRDLD